MNAPRAGYGVLPCSVMDREDLTIYAKMLYVALSSFGGLDEIRPGHKRLGQIVGCSERKIREALAELKRHGLVEWKTMATPTGKISIYRNVQPWTGVRQEVPDLRGVRQEVPDGSGTEVREGAAPGAGKVTKEVTSKDLAAQKRGTRLPEDWVPSEAVRAQIISERSDLNLLLEHENFCDYWHAKAGRDAVKLDWNATWRRWMRSANGEQSSRPVRPARAYTEKPVPDRPPWEEAS